MKKILIIALAAVAICTTGCNKYLDVNDNPNYPSSVAISNLEPAIQLAMAEKVGYDISLVGTFWSQYVVQCQSTNQYYTVMTYDLTNSYTNFRSTWSYFYSQVLPNLKVMLGMANEQELENYKLQANTMLAYTLYMLQSLYGQVAYSEAFASEAYGTGQTNTTPKFDSEKDIYKSTLDTLAVIYAQSISESGRKKVADAEAIQSSAKGDMILSGDYDGWFGFANTLYLKLLLRDFDANKETIKDVLENAEFIQTDICFDHFADEADKSNPFYESDRRQLNTNRNIRACSDILRILDSDDPRLSVYYTTEKCGSGCIGVPYGTTGNQNTTTRLNLTPTAPVYFATVEEVDFLQAEAYARLGYPDKAKEFYDAAIEASFSRLGCEGAEDYISAQYAFDSSASIEGQVEQIICQKWASNVTSLPIESWFDMSRTGYPRKSLSDDGTITDFHGVLTSGDKYPHRFLYSKGSSDYNPNTPAVSSLSEKMWWHK